MFHSQGTSAGANNRDKMRLSRKAGLRGEQVPVEGEGSLSGRWEDSRVTAEQSFLQEAGPEAQGGLSD